MLLQGYCYISNNTYPLLELWIGWHWMTGLQHAPLLRQESKTFQKEQPPRFMQKSYLLISIQLTPAAIGQATVSMNQEAGSPLPRDMLVSTKNLMHLGNLWPFVLGFSKQLVKNTNELLNESFFSPDTHQKSLLVLRSLSHWALSGRLTFPCLHPAIWKMMLCLESGKFLGFISCFHICFPVSGAIWGGCEPFMRQSLAGGNRSLLVAH